MPSCAKVPICQPIQPIRSLFRLLQITCFGIRKNKACPHSTTTMVLRQFRSLPCGLLLLLVTLGLITQVSASYGDHLPEFKHCVEVR